MISGTGVGQNSNIEAAHQTVKAVICAAKCTSTYLTWIACEIMHDIGGARCHFCFLWLQVKRYNPFGQGVRNCLGQQLARMNVPTAVAMFVAQFDFSLAPEVRPSSWHP